MSKGLGSDGGENTLTKLHSYQHVFSGRASVLLPQYCSIMLCKFCRSLREGRRPDSEPNPLGKNRFRPINSPLYTYFLLGQASRNSFSTAVPLEAGGYFTCAACARLSYRKSFSQVAIFFSSLHCTVCLCRVSCKFNARGEYLGGCSWIDTDSIQPCPTRFLILLMERLRISSLRETLS